MSTANQNDQFTDLLSNLCSDLSDYKNPMHLVGDFNLDALQYNSNHHVTDYINLLFSYGLLQIITKPTRVTLNSATLIDHWITNSSSKSLETVILMS
jgi:hypothetical protein